MKKLLVMILVFLVGVPLILGGVLAWSWYNTDESAMPNATLQVNGKTVSPAGYEWYQPLFGGLTYKEFSEKTTLEAQSLGSMTEPEIDILFPEGFDSRIDVTLGGQNLWNGAAAEWGSYTFTQNGTYIIQVTSTREPVGTKGYGSFTYRLTLDVRIAPEIELSSDRVAQGEVLAVEVCNLTDGTVPVGTTNISGTDIGTIAFAENGPGKMLALIPTNYYTDPGTYSLRVTAGATSWDLEFRITSKEFERQDLEIDTSNEQIGEANSAAAYQEYRDRIYPTFDVRDDAIYWEGAFLQPVAGHVTTSYGMRRYTNGSDSATPHAGVDYSALEGTSVQAPNNGRVIFSDYLLNTGNTIVIEHGNGLHTYYFHLSERTVEEDEMVYKGQEIGAVGSTGYSTGPHLHYEMRIGNQSIDPTLLYSTEYGMFKFD